MPHFTFTVTIEAETPELAASILNERISHDEEYPELGDPEYTIGGGQRAYSEAEWDAERQEWGESPREQVIVQWNDPQEVPTQAVTRLNAEAIENWAKYTEARDKLRAIEELVGPLLDGKLAELLK